MRAGANEFLYPPLGDSLRKARRAAGPESARGARKQPASGKVLGFLSAKGGCGRDHHRLPPGGGTGTGERAAAPSTACWPIWIWQSGIVGFLMKVKSPYSVLDAVQNLHRLDVSYWNALVASEWPGLEIIAAPSGYLPKDPFPEKRCARWSRLCGRTTPGRWSTWAAR